MNVRGFGIVIGGYGVDETMKSKRMKLRTVGFVSLKKRPSNPLLHYHGSAGMYDDRLNREGSPTLN